MEPNFEFIEITLEDSDTNKTSPMTEKQFYEWIRNNSKEAIIAISSLKYKINNHNYYFRIERSKQPILNKWDAINIYSKSDDASLNFTFDWLRGLDFRIHFERKLKEALTSSTENNICVCREQNRIRELGLRNAAI